MTATSPFLNDLPSHIIHQIAQLTKDERTIWNMMGSSRALRDAAEAAMKPYLAERKVTGDPPFVTDIFEPIDVKFAESDRARGLLLSKPSDRLDNIFQAYTPALTLIRKLVLEINDFSTAPGWKILHRASSYLTSLELHVEDIFWSQSVEFEPHGGDGRSAIIETAMGSAEIWETAFDGKMRSENSRLMASLKDVRSTSFPNLTTLVMATQARGGEHLARFLKFAPNLRDITLSCHFQGVYDMDQPELLSSGSYPKLERLTLTGHGVLVNNVLIEMGPLSPNLRQLIISISEAPDQTPVFLSGADVALALAQCQALKGLAIYGAGAGNMTRHMAYVADKGTFKAFSGLKELMIEQSGKYNLLSDPIKYQPSMPLLERIIWVDKMWNDHSKARVVTRDLPALRSNKLFSRYPNLQSAGWVSHYPQDPFNTAEVDRIIKYRVNRDGEEAEA